MATFQKRKRLVSKETKDYSNQLVYMMRIPNKKVLTGLCSSLLLAGCIDSGTAESVVEDVSSLAEDNSTFSESVASSTEVGEGGGSDSLVPVGDCRLSVLDERYLARLNEVRAEARFCGDTFYQAVDPVVWNCTLEGAAETHSEDMGDNNFFSHSGSDGLRVGARADAAGYDWVMVGENIAVGFSSVNSVMQGWLDSPSHCRTIMNGNYQETAMSLHLPSGADYSSYWTMLMGRPSSL